MKQKQAILNFLMSSLLTLGANCLFAQAPYGHDVSKAEEFRVRDGLPNLFKKLKPGEEITIGFIGGSITNGGLWRTKTLDWLKSEYPNAN